MKLLPPIFLAFNSIIAAFAANPVNGTAPPKNWGVALYRSFDSIDVFGPLNPLWYLAFSLQLNLALIAPSLSPVWVEPVDPALNKQNSSFWFSINPTHTYADPPKDIEVLLVPGGPGSRMSDVDEVINFVKKTYPGLKYLITTCTGAGIAARAGVLDGKRATTNKKAWKTVTAMGPDVKWVSPARWTVDGNIWTSSGVSKPQILGFSAHNGHKQVTSGLDLIFAFIEEVYGTTYAKDLQGIIEFNRVKDACEDSFAEEHQVPPSGDCFQS
ncbi:DJ-1 family [Fusarium acutatum]|uniref:DJ-1 family n=1 Tax=Fusarium acutatum TaxID=78861 RepID=A0A8H4JNQ4_9HYPO|nr:DJ-1 family [Fusarium acutatum]